MKQLQRTSPFHQGLLALIILILGLTSCTGTTTPSVNVPSATLEPSIEPSATKNAANPVTATLRLPSEPTPDPLIDDPENLEGRRFVYCTPGLDQLHPPQQMLPVNFH